MTGEPDKNHKAEDQEVVCDRCKGHRSCQICAGSGVWYKGSVDEEECGTCKGSRLCFFCAGYGVVIVSRENP